MENKSIDEDWFDIKNESILKLNKSIENLRENQNDLKENIKDLNQKIDKIFIIEKKILNFLCNNREMYLNEFKKVSKNKKNNDLLVPNLRVDNLLWRKYNHKN